MTTIEVDGSLREEGRRGLWRWLALVLLIVATGCGADQRSETDRPASGQATDDWPIRHVDGVFLLRVPRDMVYKPQEMGQKGTGFLSNGRMDIYIHYGLHAPSPPFFNDRPIKTERAEIGERRVTLTWYEQGYTLFHSGTPAPYVIHAMFDGNGDRATRLSVGANCVTPADRATAERIIRSVRFLPKPGPAIPPPSL